MRANSFIAAAIAASAVLLATAVPAKANGGAQWSVTVDSPRYYRPPPSAVPPGHPYYPHGTPPPAQINPPGPFLQPSPDSFMYPQPVYPNRDHAWREQEWRRRQWEIDRAQRQREWEERRRDHDRRSWVERDRMEQERRWREWRQNDHPDRDWHAPNPRFGNDGRHHGPQWGHGGHHR